MGMEGQKEKRRMLFFRSGTEYFVLSIASVEEISVDRDVTPVPMAPPLVIGVINHRGRIFTVVDFALLAGLPSGERGNAVVLLYRSDMSVGFAVRSVEGIEWVPDRLLEGAAVSDGGGKLPFLRGVLDFNGRVANVVDPEELFEAIVQLPDVDPKE